MHLYCIANKIIILVQLQELRKSSLARLLCDNSDDMALIQPLAFSKPSFL